MPDMISRNRVGHAVARAPALASVVIESSPGPIANEPVGIHRGPGHKVASPPALGALVIESRPPPVSSNVVTITRGPGRKITKGPTFNAPKPPLVDSYDDYDGPDFPRAA